MPTEGAAKKRKKGHWAAGEKGPLDEPVQGGTGADKSVETRRRMGFKKIDLQGGTSLGMSAPEVSRGLGVKKTRPRRQLPAT